MKVVRMTRGGALRVLTEEQPSPRCGQVLVRIRSACINPHDDLVVRGVIPAADGRVPLSDAAGEVLACGEDVTELRVGDRVVSTFWPYWLAGEMTDATRKDIPGETIDGYASEFVCMPAHAFTRAPAHYSHTQAATLPCAAVTAWRGLVTLGQVRPGDSVLLLGSGAVSLFALQFAKAAGARVIATSSCEEKLARLEALGADDLIDYAAVPEWSAEVRALTGGRGVDHVIEVGGATTLAQSIAACRRGGHIAVTGLLSGVMAQLNVPALFSAQVRLSGVSIGNRTDQQDMIRAIEVNGLKPVLDRSFGLERIGDAFEYFRTGRAFGKVTVDL